MENGTARPIRNHQAYGRRRRCLVADGQPRGMFPSGSAAGAFENGWRDMVITEACADIVQESMTFIAGTYCSP